MKPRSTLFALYILFSMSVPMLAQDSSSVEPFEALEIKGVITVGDDGADGAFVELFEGNRVVEAFETKKKGKFKFTLYNDMVYMIQITKSGYYPKRISVSTKLPEGYADFEKFHFDIGLISKDEAKYDPYLAEYPSALIAFDQKKKEFAYDKDYTRSYFDEIDQAEK